MNAPDNPFQLTRAADLDDNQILKLWVDVEGDVSFDKKFRPTSQLPMMLLGGKGSGKTHLMRYYSFAVQRLRAGDDSLFESIKRSGYLGIYLRCSGLNASRFSGKGQDAARWTDIFAYYVELWFAQLVLAVATDFMRYSKKAWSNEKELVESIGSLFDRLPQQEFRSVEELSKVLRELQKELDFAINNAALTRELKVTILTTRGALLFGIPQQISRLEPCFEGLLFTWLIDEYENLYEDAQRYINTLIREKQLPVTFKIGAKLYGVRTYKTLSGDEELKEGSEYELMNLDAELRAGGKTYEKFMLKVCEARLRVYWGNLAPGQFGLSRKSTLNEWFADEKTLQAEKTELGIAAQKFLKKERPWISNLRKKVSDALCSSKMQGITSMSDVDRVVDELLFDDLLLEKTNCFLFYRAWNDGENLARAAKKIKSQCRKFSENQGDENTEHFVVLDKFKDDLKAQAIRECKGKPTYSGLDTFIAMSHGIPRNLLIILKHVYDWSAFNGERPFVTDVISIAAQRAGVLEAAEWFIRDAQILGKSGVQVKTAVDRLGNLFRGIRFSDKPSECSLCTFSVDSAELNPVVQGSIETAEQWSLLIRTSDRKERNSDKVVSKFQLNAMLAPKYWLPVYSRGNIHLSAKEAAAVFTSEIVGEFDQVLKVRTKGMNAPFVTVERSQLSQNEPSLF